MLRGLAIVVCILGCREPTFTPKDAAAPGGVVVAKGGAGATVTGELGTLTYQASFATTGLHLLDALSIDGQPILGRNTSVSCNAEDMAGIAVFPAERVSHSLPSTATIITANEPQTQLLGPAIGKIHVPWSTEYICGASTRKQLDGKSTYTFFPDGRIVRYESFRQDVAGAAMLSDCDCASGAAQFFPTTFITFDPTAFDRVVGEMGSGVTDRAMLAPNEQVTPGRVACTYRDTRQLSIVWPDQETRIRRASGTAATLAFVYDMQPMPTNMIPETYAFATRSMMFVDNEAVGCGRAGARASAHLTLRRLMVNETAVDLTSIDGIYGGQEPNSEIAGLFVTGNVTLRQTAQGPIPAGFAVWLGWGMPVTPRVMRAPASPSAEPWYLMQQPTTESAVIWFRDGLGANETIEIRID